MHKERLENSLIRHCAPTLAGIKRAGLFSYFFEDAESASAELAAVNRLLNARGVFVEALVWRETSVLVYAYRYSQLREALARTEVRELLAPYGYPTPDTDACIAHLRTRVGCSDCFPHEIGVFLGYPIEDVRGFILHGGKDCKSCGLWKVYCDPAAAEKQFDKINKCSRVYRQVFSEGRSLVQLTVCA